MRPRLYALQANIEQEIAIQGDYIRCESSTGDFFVDLGKGGRPIRLRTGKSVTTQQKFGKVIVYSETAQTVELEIGDDRISDNELSGSVQVSNTIGQIEASKTQSSQMSCYAGSMAAILAGPPLYPTFINNTGADLYITRMVASEIMAAAGGANINAGTYDGNGAALAAALIDKSDFTAVKVGQFGAEAADRLTGVVTIARLEHGGSGEIELFSEQAPLKLANNQGINFAIAGSAGDKGSLLIEAQTEVPQSFSGAAAQNAGAGENTPSVVSFILAPEFETTASDAAKVVRAGMRSTATDENGVSNGDNFGGGHDITAAGIDPNGVRAHAYDISAQTAALQAAGWMGIEVDGVFNDDGYAPASTQYLMSVPRFWLEHRTNGRARVGIASALGTNGSSDEMSISPLSKAGGFNIAIGWTGLNITIYVDGLPWQTKTAATWDDSFDSDFYAGGLTSIAADYEGNRVKDFVLLSRDHDFAVSNESVLFLGDSLTCQGGVPLELSAPTNSGAAAWIPDNGQGGPNGFDGDGVTDYGASAMRDAGYVPTVFRTLYKAGIEALNNINLAQSGGSVDDGETQLTGFAGTVPNNCISLLGTNNAASLDDTAQFRADYESLITALENAGVSRLIIGTIPSMEASAGGAVDRSGQTYRDKTDALNAEIAGLKAWAIAQGYGIYIQVVDTFTTLGGHAVDLNDFNANNLHPNESGSHKIGLAMGAALRDAITG